MKRRISNADFVHTHFHTEYSSFDGLNKLSTAPLLARKMGFRSLAITDHGTMGGAIKFINECTKTKDKNDNVIPYDPIKPIIGSEIYLSRNRFARTKAEQHDMKRGNRHLILLAKNWVGYQNLCTLSQKSWVEGYGFSSPRLDWDLLSKHSEGLIASSACLSSVINANLLHDRYDQAKKVTTKLKDIFGDDFFLEVMYHGIDAEGAIIPDVLKLGTELDIKTICSNDCFVKGTFVSTENGPELIENIRPGDLVISHKNRLCIVEKCKSREIEKTITVTTGLGTSAFECTPEHPVFVSTCDYKRRFTEPVWKKARDLTANDYLLIQKSIHEEHPFTCNVHQDWIDIESILGSKFNEDIQGNYYVTYQGFDKRRSKVKIPLKLKVCKDLLFALGRFVAEGYSDNNSHQIGFAANCDEIDINNRLEKYFARFGITSYRPKNGKDCRLVFSSKIFKNLFIKLCGTGAENKHLPTIDGTYRCFSKTQILEILKGYVGGDGHISKKAGRPSVICASTSKILAYQISDVLHSLGFVCFPTVRNFSKTKHKNPKADPQNWTPLYVVHMSDCDTPKFCKLVGIDCDQKCVKRDNRRKYIDIGSYYAVKIRSIIENNNRKIVYNLQVNGDETFLANSYVVHNCHYGTKDMGKSHEVLMAISTSKCLHDPRHLHFPYDEFYLKSASEMAKIFGTNPDLLLNTNLVAERIDSDEIIAKMKSGMRLPKYIVPEGFKDPLQYMTHLAQEGMKKIGWDKSKAHVERLNIEVNDVKVALDVNRYDFATYFLIVRDYIKKAQDRNILTGPGRGSGYGSVLLRVLEISYGPDPISQGLFWERFLGFDTLQFISEQDFFGNEVASDTEKLVIAIDDVREVEDDMGGVDRY